MIGCPKFTLNNIMIGSNKILILRASYFIKIFSRK